jgi:transcription termination factor NusB
MTETKQPRKPEPQDTTGRPESTGFEVLVKIHTKEADQKLTDPELLRFLVGKVIDNRYKLEEEIDYTLEVRRVYR